MKQNPKKKKRKNLIKASIISLSCLGLQGLRVAMAGTATLPITVRLVRAIEVTLENSLDFGTLAMTLERAGTARIDPALNRLIIDGNSSLALAGGTPTVGRLNVKGVNFPVTISMEDTSVKLSNGETSITVHNFNFMTANGGDQITILPQTGQNSFTVQVGASLVTKPNQLEGTYIGSTRVYTNFQ